MHLNVRFHVVTESKLCLSHTAVITEMSKTTQKYSSFLDEILIMEYHSCNRSLNAVRKSITTSVLSKNIIRFKKLLMKHSTCHYHWS